MHEAVIAYSLTVLYSAGSATLEVARAMLPPIFAGFFVASFLRSSPGFSRLRLPTSKLAALANLPPDCAAALALFLVNSWAGLAALSDARRKGSIDDRELIVAILVGFIPKGINNLILFSIPVAISVLGLFLGGLYVLLDLSASLAVALSGVIIGRAILEPRGFRAAWMEPVHSKGLVQRVRSGLRDMASNSLKVARVLLPTVFIAQLAISYLLKLPAVEQFSSLIAPLGLTPSSIIVLLASTVSQSAALVASGTLMSSDSISGKACLVLLFMARFIHLGIGCLRVGLPANVSYFGFSLGIRATAVEYLLIEVSNIVIIMSLYTFLPHQLVQ